MGHRVEQRGGLASSGRFGLAVMLACGISVAIGCEERSGSGGGTAVTVDGEMQQAVNEGRTTLPLFVEAFREPREDWLAFQIRYSFKGEDGYRGTVWLELESIEEDGSFVGSVAADEDPRLIPFEPGERLTVPASEVSDWSFLDERGRWYGGYTLRVTMDRNLGTGVDPTDNIHGGTEFVDLGKPEPSDEDEEPGDGPGGMPE